MTCSRCGAAIHPDARFCPSCGLLLTVQGPADRLRQGYGGRETGHDDRRATGRRRADTGDYDLTGGVTRESPAAAGARARGTPPPRSGAASEGWLSGADAISHGRFAPGTVFDGRYRILGVLGRGGMGEVYRADDLRLGQPVALKFLPASLSRDPVRLAQFHNEVRVARQISHPTVCRVYDIGEADGVQYLSMEYVDGEDLASSLRRVGRFPEDRATEIARQLCAGVAAAHERGVVHRDLKPANVMLDGSGRVRIMDFGLAAIGQVDDIRSGTPAYMAPEQLRGTEVTRRSDIFALGLVLYELFTGRRAFTAPTLGELASQHESGPPTAPSTIVTSLDPAIERAILRCLDPDPARRPSSALAVSAALPGGDPLAAALAAGETPSPEMVAAAGQGAGLSPRVAWAVLLAAVAGAAIAYVLSVPGSMLVTLDPRLPPEVLAQNARDLLEEIGYAGPPRDDAYGFGWNQRLAGQLRERAGPGVVERPSPLFFWYRQSAEPLMAITFHTDLLTPGIVRTDDPPPIMSGMIEVTLDHAGRLTSFEAIQPQRLDAPVRPAAIDWSPLFEHSGLDPSRLRAAEPLWTFLAASDTRAAWTGMWPGSERPLRIEAGALRGRPTAFLLVDDTTVPSRMADPADDGINAAVFVLLGLTLLIVGGATTLAVKNLRAGRGDRKAAARLGASVTAILLAVWACQVHVVGDSVFVAIFLLAVCTAVFYGVLHWTLYLALEPFVRRHWPQVLVSLVTLLSGRARDPVVGRDVLFGVALGVTWSLLLRVLDVSGLRPFEPVFPGAIELLHGLRATLGLVFEEVPYAIRNALFYFFLLFVLRVLLRGEWRAAFAFASIFGLVEAVTSAQALVEGLTTFVYFWSGAVAILRLGLVAMAVGSLVLAVSINMPATFETSAWYFGNMALLGAIVITLAVWAAYTATAGKLVKMEL